MKRDGEERNGGDGTVVCLVENVSDDEVDKTTAAATTWCWDAESIRTARVKGQRSESLVIEFDGDGLDAGEIGRLEEVLGKAVRQVRDNPATHTAWVQVWLNTLE